MSKKRKTKIDNPEPNKDHTGRADIGTYANAETLTPLHTKLKETVNQPCLFKL
jgi:hypothetical protein